MSWTRDPPYDGVVFASQEVSSWSLAVVGGGIVGLATAHAAVRAGRSVVVLEAEPDVALHQSGRNSGVVHSGIYYEPGSEKARLCVAGRDLLYRYCGAREIPVRRCGKLLVATDPAELARLEILAERGRANGLDGLCLLGSEGVREREPRATGIGGLWVPQAGVVDFRRVAEALAHDVRAEGGDVRTEARVLDVGESSQGVTLETARGRVHCERAVNCAGLESDRVARLAGIEPGVRILPFRGEYMELRAARRELVRGLLYPVPAPGLPFLGVHFTRTISGSVLVGPNAVPAGSRYGYARRDLSWRFLAEAAAFPGTWRLAASLWRQGLSELRRASSRRAFVAAARRLLPELEPDDLEVAPSGVRAQAVDRSGRLVDDFRFARSRRMLHVLNAPSPAATAALAIGERIAALVGS